MKSDSAHLNSANSPLRSGADARSILPAFIAVLVSLAAATTVVSAQPATTRHGEPVDGLQLSIDSVAGTRGTTFTKDDAAPPHYFSTIKLTTTLRNIGKQPIYLVCPDEPQIRQASLSDRTGHVLTAYDEASQTSDAAPCDVSDIITLAPSQERHIAFQVYGLRKVPPHGKYTILAALRKYKESNLTPKAIAYLKRNNLHLWPGPDVKSAALTIELK